MLHRYNESVPSVASAKDQAASDLRTETRKEAVRASVLVAAAQSGAASKDQAAPDLLTEVTEVTEVTEATEVTKEGVWTSLLVAAAQSAS